MEITSTANHSVPVPVDRAPFKVLLGTWFLVVLYAYPGYLNFDAADQLLQARRGVYGDWHPPLMAAYWRVLELIFRGPVAMLVVQVTLFLWGLYRLLRLRLAPRTAAWVAAGLMLFPPILTPMAPVWKDAQMAAFLLAGLALLLEPEPRWGRRALGCLLLMFACGVRDNALAALPPLCVLVATRSEFRSRLAGFALLIGLIVVPPATAFLINHGLAGQRTNPWARSVGPMDLIGIVCLADPISDAELKRDLEGTGYADDITEGIQRRFCAAYSSRDWFGTGVIFNEMPSSEQVAARHRAWRVLVRKHPSAYLSHRSRVMAEVLGLTDAELWEPVCQNSAIEDQYIRLRHFTTPSYLQKRLGRAFGSLSRTMVYRPWVYLALSVVFLGWAAWRRDGLVAALVASGLLYQSSFFVGAAAPDFRYSHWMITLCCLAAALIVADRLSLRHRPHATAPPDTSREDPSKASGSRATS